MDFPKRPGSERVECAESHPLSANLGFCAIVFANFLIGIVWRMDRLEIAPGSRNEVADFVVHCGFRTDLFPFLFTAKVYVGLLYSVSQPGSCWHSEDHQE